MAENAKAKMAKLKINNFIFYFVLKIEIQEYIYSD